MVYWYSTSVRSHEHRLHSIPHSEKVDCVHEGKRPCGDVRSSVRQRKATKSVFLAGSKPICRQNNIVLANFFFEYFCTDSRYRLQGFATLVKNNRKRRLPRRYHCLSKLIYLEQMGFDPAGKHSFDGTSVGEILHVLSNRRSRQVGYRSGL